MHTHCNPRLLSSLYTYSRSVTSFASLFPPVPVSASINKVAAAHLASAHFRKFSNFSSSLHSSTILTKRWLMSSGNSTSFSTSAGKSSSSSASTGSKHSHSSACSHHTGNPKEETEDLFGRIRKSIETKNMLSNTDDNKVPEDAAENPSQTNSPRSQNSAYQSPSPSAYSVIHPSSTIGRDSSELQGLFDNNRAWADKMEAEYPGFFNGLKNQQKPKYMWIGCSDSRVPATEITGLMPGEIFVHRNVANVVITTDLNLLSCLQIAIDLLKVEHIIVCGHYGCAGVHYALTPTQLGISDYWIRSIKDVARHHADRLAAMETDEERHALLSELNVMEQVHNVCHTPIVQDAWRRNQPLAIHGWIYGVGDGLLKNLVNPSIKGFDQVSPAYHFDRKH